MFILLQEVIYLIPKPKFKLAPKANGFGDVWEFSQDLNNNHPAPFPVDLIDRIVASTTAKVVLDPFMGSGTTAISALNHGRQYVGIERAEEYCDLARQRIKRHKREMKKAS